MTLQEAIQAYYRSDHDHSLKILEVVREKTGDSATIQYWKASNLIRQMRISEAFLSIERSLSMDPGQADALSLKGVLLYHMNKLEESLEHMNKAREIEPGNPYRYSSRAYIKDALGDLEGAIQDYEYAIELDPEDAVSHNNLGLLKEKMGYRKQAGKHFETADRLAIDVKGRLVTMPEAKGQKATRIEAGLSPGGEDREKLTLAHVLQTLKLLITSNSERKAFLEYMRGFLGRR